MSSDQPSLTEFYQGWDVYQGHLVKAVTPLTREQLELRSASHLRTLGEIASHIIRTRAAWFYRVMGEGGPEIVALLDWDLPDTPARSAAELVQGLETSWRLIQDCLARWTPDDLEHLFEGMDGDDPYSLTRQWVLWHLIEHDLHHGGELSLTLGIHGLAAPDL